MTLQEISERLQEPIEMARHNPQIVALLERLQLDLEIAQRREREQAKQMGVIGA